MRWYFLSLSSGTRSGIQHISRNLPSRRRACPARLRQKGHQPSKVSILSHDNNNYDTGYDPRRLPHFCLLVSVQVLEIIKCSREYIYIYISIYFLCCKNIFIEDSVFVFLVLRGLFSFLFGQNPFSNCDFRPDISEASKIKADVLLKWWYLLHQGYTVGATIFEYRQTCKIIHLQSIYFMMGM